MRLLKSIKAVSIALLLGAITVIEVVEPATSLPTEGTLIARARRRLNFQVGVRSSRYRVGGYSRSASCGKDKVLTALVPPPQNQELSPATGITNKATDKAADKTADKTGVVDKTTAEHPTFFVHVPSLPATTAQFTLQNEAGTGKDLYTVQFQLTGKPGIVGISVPDSVPALQVGQKYFWQLSVACDPDAAPSDRSSDIVVNSWVERVNATAPTEGDRIAALAEKGIWQDTLALLALQRYQQPDDSVLAEDWASLMDGAGLSQFKQATIVQIVKN